MSYPEFIKNLPQADLPMPGITAHLLSGEKGQAVFFELPAGAEVPPHSHGAQWGMVIEGSIQLTIGGETRIYRKGDSYVIGDGEEHSAVVKEPSRVIDVFADNDRYKAK